MCIIKIFLKIAFMEANAMRFSYNAIALSKKKKN